MIGLVGLKKAPLQAGLLVPLPFITIIFRSASHTLHAASTPLVLSTCVQLEYMRADGLVSARTSPCIHTSFTLDCVHPCSCFFLDKSHFCPCWQYCTEAVWSHRSAEEGNLTDYDFKLCIVMRSQHASTVYLQLNSCAPRCSFTSDEGAKGRVWTAGSLQVTFS